MRLSKRHLKRIIREEYSKLKRRGLIKEANGRISNEDEMYDAQDIVENECSDQTILSIASYGKESEFAYNYMSDGTFDADQIDEIREACVELAYQGLTHKFNGIEQAMDLWDICSAMADRVRYEMQNP